MGLFDAYKGSTTELDGNFNEFIPQYILVKVYGTEKIRTCLYRAISRISGVDVSEIKPEMKLADDLGMDNLDLFEVCIQLKGHIVFQSRENEFLDWVDLLMESLESSSDLLPGYEGMTVAQLEKKVDSGHPMYAAKVR